MTINENLDQSVMPEIIYKISKEGVPEPYIEATCIDTGKKILVPVLVTSTGTMTLPLN